ncbi:uncharacterized protein LOC111382383 [Olea europaea var. sylvestris]|uniref:uncharacterized protein LOC111382383 n=1 Tax=Olea europaea var. sylvestris TaxID=158386 RepID=UPI000C1CCDBC|nr:uncharacterized protein LOC111382383 [Olea europaea var. sylvestris]
MVCTSTPLSVPSYFDGSNYANLKVRMRAFLKSMDERIWLNVVDDWSAPSTTVDNDVTPSPIENWSKAELDKCNWNSKALHALFMAISPRNLGECPLATRFEEIKMREDETFDIFYASINDIVNSSFNLSEKIPKPKIIPNSKDIDTIKLEELVRSIQTYELTVRNPAKEKSLALKSAKNNQTESSDSNSPNDEEMAYPAKKFRKMLRNKKKLQEKSRASVSKSRRRSKSMRCHNYQGVGHVKRECPSAKIIKEKAMNTTLTDNESSLDNQSEKSTHEESEKFVAFVARFKSGSEQGNERDEDLDSGEDSSDESELHLEKAKLESYVKESSTILSELKSINESSKSQVKNLSSELERSSKRIGELTAINETLDIQVVNLVSELEHYKPQLLPFNSGLSKLDNMLGIDKPIENRRGLGYKGKDHDDRGLLDSIGLVDLEIDVRVHITQVISALDIIITKQKENMNLKKNKNRVSIGNMFNKECKKQSLGRLDFCFYYLVFIVSFVTECQREILSKNKFIDGIVSINLVIQQPSFGKHQSELQAQEPMVLDVSLRETFSTRPRGRRRK